MHLCETKHESCHRYRAHHSRSDAHPARLLDVQTEMTGVDVRLVPFDQARGPYAALSYCWGDRPHTSTTTSLNLGTRMESIPLDTLPATFTDAIKFCRDLGVRYLWIDALCIIQPMKGDPVGHQDWESQSSIMGHVYGNAIFTIAAQGASSAEMGLFPSCAPFDVSTSSCPLLADGGHQSVWVKAEAPDWVASVGESPLQQRAWVLQERLLSTRLVHFTQHCVFWECAEICASEFEPCGTETGGLRTLSVMLRPETEKNAQKVKDAVMFEWQQILADYTERQLSVLTDKFPAISAIAERVAELTGDRYLAGCWESRFLDDLIWVGLWKDPSYRQRSYSYSEADRDAPDNVYLAPSWSWGSVTGKVYHNMITDTYRRTVRLVSVSATPQNVSFPYGHVEPGATLQLAARVRHDVHATVIATADDDAPRYHLWFDVAHGDVLGNVVDDSLTPRHSKVAIIWFDVAGDHISQSFSAVMMTEIKQRQAEADKIVAQEPRGITGIAMLLTRLGDDKNGPYIRIGLADLMDINFFVGCPEEVLEII
jgi:hypothetical protein